MIKSTRNWFLLILVFLAGYFASQTMSSNQVVKEELLIPEARAAAPALAAPADANIFVNLAKRVVPSVVNIQTFSKGGGPRPGLPGAPMGPPGGPRSQGGQGDPFRQFFEEFFGRGMGQQEGPKGGKSVPVSLGSGFIIEASGIILTNNHVIAQADEVKVQFEEGDDNLADAEVIGTDPELDVALLKVKTKRKLEALPLGDSDALEVGEYVVAVGNPFGQGHSVTHGIISAKGRKASDLSIFATYLQTDAPINPGNSGGPLINLKGEVIGINNAIDARAQGIGFAIPSNFVKKVLPQLKTKGTVARGYIGVQVEELNPEKAQKIGFSKDTKGPLVAMVFDGSPAQKAGMETYDIVTEFNGQAILTGNDLVMAVGSTPIDTDVAVKVLRVEKDKAVTKTLNLRVLAKPTKGLAKKGPAKPGSRDARLDVGVELEELSPEIARELGYTPKGKGGVVVSDVSYGTPGDRAGFLRGDIILEVDRKSIQSVDGFFNIIRTKKSYLVRVRRMDGQGQEVFSVLVLDLKS